jgi:hypothetical protein
MNTVVRLSTILSAVLISSFAFADQGTNVGGTGFLKTQQSCTVESRVEGGWKKLGTIEVGSYGEIGTEGFKILHQGYVAPYRNVIRQLNEALQTATVPQDRAAIFSARMDYQALLYNADYMPDHCGTYYGRCQRGMEKDYLAAALAEEHVRFGSDCPKQAIRQYGADVFRIGRQN